MANKRRTVRLGPSKWAVGDPLAVREPPLGSELAVIERAAARTIAEMALAGAVPLGMIRVQHDSGWEDVLFVCEQRLEFGLMFDDRGCARAAYLTERGRTPGMPTADATPATEMETFQGAVLRCVKAGQEAGWHELGVRYVGIGGVEGLEIYNPDLMSSACFAFDRHGELWALWQGHRVAANESWFRATLPRLVRGGRV
jgi:hypothetical protein